MVDRVLAERGDSILTERAPHDKCCVHRLFAALMPLVWPPRAVAMTIGIGRRQVPKNPGEVVVAQALRSFSPNNQATASGRLTSKCQNMHRISVQVETMHFPVNCS
jgi:hypothetical protein